VNPPLFKVGQRVYNRALPIHGKVIGIFTMGIQWFYTIELDKPNPLNESCANYGEDGLRATLEEAIEWQNSNPPPDAV
jgi:hypothetical protein